jgi:hypothetical protein
MDGVPLMISGEDNEEYLRVKRDLMGHLLIALLCSSINKNNNQRIRNKGSEQGITKWKSGFSWQPSFGSLLALDSFDCDLKIQLK